MNMLTILCIIILPILSGWLYRRGGTSKGTLWRDIGCSVVTLLACWFLGLKTSPGVTFWAYLLAFGLSWGALASYWGLDEQKWGYWAHGLGLSLALLPIAYITGHWLGFALRTIILTTFITLWSEYTTIDWIEEFGRGIGIILTLPILLI